MEVWNIRSRASDGNQVKSIAGAVAGVCLSISIMALLVSIVNYF